MKTVYMFSGQGSQAVGMGKKLYDSYKECKKVFDTASQVLGYDIKKICFEHNESLNSTEFSQPAIFTVSMAAYEMLKQAEIPDCVMGFSLGEYSALTAAGALKFEEALRLVKIRGELMSRAHGGMSAVTGVGVDKLTKLCALINGVYVANHNTHDQVVVSGTDEALGKLELMVKELKGKSMRLKVSGPFHSPLLQNVADEFNKTLAGIKLNQLDIPLITNVTGDFVPNEPDKILENLKVHMLSRVKWVTSVEKTLEDGAEKYIEVGHGKTLVNFVNKINQSYEKKIAVLASDDVIAKNFIV